MTKENLQKRNSQAKHITFLSLITDLLAWSVILPLLPPLLDYYSKNDSSGLYNIFQTTVDSYQDYIGVPKGFSTVLFGGLLGSMFSFLQFLSSPITGALSDSYGRKPILLLTLIGLACSYSVWVFASNFALFVLSRIIGGLSKGNVSLSYCIMTDVSDAANRSKGMALIGIAFSFGFTIGPLIGVLFSKWGSDGWYEASACYALALSLLNILLIAFSFKETLPKEKRAKSVFKCFGNAWKFISPYQLFSFGAVDKLEKKEKQKLQHLGMVYFLFMLFFSGLEFTITFVTHHIHGFTSISQGKMFTMLGIIMALVQGGYVRRLKPGSEIRVSCVGLALMVPSFIIVGHSTSTAYLYLGLCSYVVGSSLVTPCLSAVVSQFGDHSQKGAILGIWRSMAAFGRSIGPILASLGFWSCGAQVTYTVGGILFIIPLFLLRKY